MKNLPSSNLWNSCPTVMMHFCSHPTSSNKIFEHAQKSNVHIQFLSMSCQNVCLHSFGLVFGHTSHVICQLQHLQHWCFGANWCTASCGLQCLQLTLHQWSGVAMLTWTAAKKWMLQNLGQLFKCCLQVSTSESKVGCSFFVDNFKNRCEQETLCQVFCILTGHWEDAQNFNGKPPLKHWNSCPEPSPKAEC